MRIVARRDPGEYGHKPLCVIGSTLLLALGLKVGTLYPGAGDSEAPGVGMVRRSPYGLRRRIGYSR